MKTLKNDGNFDGFSKLFLPDQGNERWDIQLSIKKKYFRQTTFTDNARL